MESDSHSIQSTARVTGQSAEALLEDLARPAAAAESTFADAGKFATHNCAFYWSMMTLGTTGERADLDGLKRAGKPSWVIGVLALTLALLFGAITGAPTSHSGTAHQLLAPENHHGSWSGGHDGTQHPLMLHAEGEQVETPDTGSHAFAQLTTGAAAHVPAPALVEQPTGAPSDHAPARSVLQVWRT